MQYFPLQRLAALLLLVCLQACHTKQPVQETPAPVLAKPSPQQYAWHE